MSTTAIPSASVTVDFNGGNRRSLERHESPRNILNYLNNHVPGGYRGFVQTGQFSGIFTWTNSRGRNIEYSELFEGIFLPPVSTYYTWYILGDGYNDIWVFPDECSSPVPGAPVAKSTFDTDRYDLSSEQKYDPMWLEAGARYYVASLHAEDQRVDNHLVGVRMHDAAKGVYHLERDQSVYEVQEWEIP